MTQTVWLARHGNRQDFVDPDWPKTAVRPYDPGLSPDGIEQAQKVGRRLVDEGIECIFASPYLRTVETAHYVAERLDVPIYLEQGLGEWLNQAWFPAEPERLPPEALAERFPHVDLNYRSRLVPAYPETVETALGRAGETARLLAEAHAGTILIVGHGVSVTGAAVGLVPGTDVPECALCSLFKIVYREGAWQMDLCADVSHLGYSEAATRFV